MAGIFTAVTVTQSKTKSIESVGQKQETMLYSSPNLQHVDKKRTVADEHDRDCPT